MSNATKSPPKTSKGVKPVIGIGGFFGYGNYGDELFLEVFNEYLGDEFTLKPLPDLASKPYFSRDVKELVAEVDGVLIGGGDLVQPWAMDPRYFNREYLTKPVFVAGVGVPIRAQTNTTQVERPDIVERYKTFFNHPSVKFIHARDMQSVNWIKNKCSPEVEVIEAPDVVCALTFPKAPPRDPANPILGIVTRHRPGKDQLDDYTQIEALGNRAIAQGYRVHHIILGTVDVGKRDVINAERVNIPGKKVIYSESLDDLSRAIGECTALASMKFHGSVAATMYGVPSMVLVPTSKNRNFMRRMGREDLLCVFDSPDLVSRFETFPDPIDPYWVKKLREDSQALFASLKACIKANV